MSVPISRQSNRLTACDNSVLPAKDIHSQPTREALVECLDPVETLQQFAVNRRARGLTLWEIADLLNDAGYTTPKGARFTHSQIRRLLEGSSK